MCRLLPLAQYADLETAISKIVGNELSSAMPARAARILEVRPSDLATFLGVVRYGTLSETARELGVTASQVSKALIRLERALDSKLLERRGRRISISATGRSIVPQCQDVLERLERLASGETPEPPHLILASSALVGSLVVPGIAREHPELRLRCIELPPRALGAYATQGALRRRRGDR